MKLLGGGLPSHNKPGLGFILLEEPAKTIKITI